MVFRMILTSVLKIDPVTDTATTIGSLSGTYKWAGGILAPNGMVYGIPYNSTTVLKIDMGLASPFDVDVLLAAYYNKY